MRRSVVLYRENCVISLVQWMKLARAPYPPSWPASLAKLVLDGFSLTCSLDLCLQTSPLEIIYSYWNGADSHRRVM